MAEVVLDANVIVAILYEADSQHRRARELVDRLEGAGDSLKRLASNVLDVVTKTAGRLNANDALLVALMQEGAVDGLVSFDAGFDAVEGFRRIS